MSRWVLEAPPRLTPEARLSLDPRVVEAARRGDEDALTRLLTESYPFVRRWTAGHGADPSDVEDATQDVMIAVVRRLAAFRGESRFTTWLYRVTRNAWLDRMKAHRREEGRRRTLEAEAAHAQHEGTGSEEDPGDALDRRRVGARIAEAFRALPPRQREVFDLADVQGFTGPEVAEMLGIEPSTVRVTLLKARRALRTRLLALDPTLGEELGHDV